MTDDELTAWAESDDRTFDPSKGLRGEDAARAGREMLERYGSDAD